MGHGKRGRYLEVGGERSLAKRFESTLSPLYARRMIYVCAGMYRSGSTWLYNAARHILQHASVPDLATGWISEKDAILGHENALIKIHSYDPDLAARADVVLTSHRDLRDVAASLFRKFKLEFSTEPILETVQDYSRWVKIAAYDLHYERLLVSKMDELRKVAAVLKLPPAAVAALPLETILSEIEGEQFTEGRSTEQRFDAVNLMHENHVTDGRHGSWEGFVPDELIRAIEAEFANWMREKGYLARTVDSSGNHTSE
jgi:hypothetical protein